MRVLIAGQAKSGTTALYFALKQSLPASYISLFEPEHFTYPEPDVLAKIIIGYPSSVALEEFAGFERKILMIRDPRDNLISRLLYLTFDLPWNSEEEKVTAFLELLSWKQWSPIRISILQLLERLSELSGEDLVQTLIRHHEYCQTFDTEHPDYFVLRYEDFIAGKVAKLEHYLGFPITFDGQVDQDFAHIARSKTTGDWRNWFTECDVIHFRPLFTDFIAKYGYATDWQLPAQPIIEFRHSVDYVRRLIQKRQAMEAQDLLDRIIADRAQAIEHLQGEVAQLQAQLQSMSNSKFWRLRNAYHAAWNRLRAASQPTETK